MSAKEKIKKIVEKWYLCEPLYFAVWTLHKIEPDTQIKTIRVHNGYIEYNPVFLDTLSKSALESVLCFEAMRIILKHPYSRKKDLPEFSYLASNITIQEYLQTNGLGFISARDFFGSDDYDRKYFEFYYDKILEQAQNASQTNNNETSSTNDGFEKNNHINDKNSNGDNESGDNNSSQDNRDKDNSSQDNRTDNDTNDNDTNDNDTNDNDTNDNDTNDNDTNDNNSDDNDRTENDSDKNGNTKDSSHADDENATESETEGGKGENTLENYTNEKATGYENAKYWDRNEYNEQLVNEKIKDISMTNTWGSITASIQEKILATLKPKIDYKMILKSFRTSILSNTRRLTRMKPSRRYDFLYMGSRRDFTTKLLFAVDVSGSVSHASLMNAFSILNRFFKYGIEEISVICFDTEIKGKVLTLKKAKKEIVITGRGGTNFSAVIDYIDTDRTFDGVIIFTDGYASCPEPPRNKKTKILWLFDTESNYQLCKNNLSKLGKVAFVKEI
jgi:predicted metal-dependent peptidase